MIGYNFQNAEQRTQRGSEIELRFDLFTIIACYAYNMNTDIVLRNHYFKHIVVKTQRQSKDMACQHKEIQILPSKTIFMGQLQQYERWRDND